MPEQNLNPDALAVAALELDMPCASCAIGNDPNPCKFCESTAERVIREYLDALPAQPDTVNSVEEIPAKIQIISWEEEPEHECWKLAPDETFVGLIVKAGRSWSSGDQYSLNISRPVEG